MKQATFADAEYAGKRKQTRRERFLIEMDRVMPWKGLIALIEPHRWSSGLSVAGHVAGSSDAELTRLQQCNDGRAVYETTILRQFSQANVFTY